MNQKDRTKIEQELVHSAIEQIRKNYEIEESTDQPEHLDNNKYYQEYEQLNSLDLLKEEHIKYCTKKLLNIGYSIFHLDVGQPWCIYWPLNSLSILKQDIQGYENKVIDYLLQCQSNGFQGGPYQLPHLAPTYSSLLSLFLIGTQKALESINRKGLEEFFWSVQDPNQKGSYLMHVNGEADMRAVYIVVIMVKILKLDEKLLEGCAEYIASCQTLEGGIGGIKYAEAHGGYTFCGYAALVCLNKQHFIDQGKLLYWLINRQMQGEGGFNGRTNKVVDACYSFWQGATFNLFQLSGYLTENIMNKQELLYYLHICQNPTGGIFDKPGKNPDAYHTCYGLSGYSLIQEDYLNPIYNIPQEKFLKVQDFFK